jgi:hypothetical protein
MYLIFPHDSIEEPFVARIPDGVPFSVHHIKGFPFEIKMYLD